MTLNTLSVAVTKPTSCRGKTDAAQRLDFGRHTERPAFDRARAIYQTCPKRYEPIIVSIIAAMFGTVTLPGRRSHVVDQLLWGGTMAVSFSDLRLAFGFVSSGVGGNEAYSTSSRAGSIGIPSSATTTRNCATISMTRNTFQFRIRESSILASLWSWIFAGEFLPRRLRRSSSHLPPKRRLQPI
jgi:hypothetical protein